MPQAGVAHGADVVSKGLLHDKDTHYRTTTADVAAFMMIATDVMPDATLADLRLTDRQRGVLDKAIWQNYDLWRPLAE